MAVRYGIPGFLFVTLGYVLIVFHVMRRDFQGDMLLTQFRRAWVFTFLGLSFTLCTVHVWTAIYSFTFFLLGAGVWLIAVDPSDDDGDGAPTDTLRPTGPVFARDFGTKAAAVTRKTPQAGVRPETAQFSRFGGSKKP